jgi:hypothetical protein
VAFALAKSALDELGKALAESGCVEPVAALCKRTAPLVADEELREAVASGDEGRLRLTADSQRLMVGKQWPVFLDVLFYERGDIQSDEIVSFGEIAFCLPSRLEPWLRDLTLSFEFDRFVLLDGEGRAVELPVGPAS